jgi:hypothetical protein
MKRFWFSVGKVKFPGMVRLSKIVIRWECHASVEIEDGNVEFHARRDTADQQVLEKRG